jgi:hypothetical protein
MQDLNYSGPDRDGDPEAMSGSTTCACKTISLSSPAGQRGGIFRSDKPGDPPRAAAANGEEINLDLYIQVAHPAIYDTAIQPGELTARYYPLIHGVQQY